MKLKTNCIKIVLVFNFTWNCWTEYNLVHRIKLLVYLNKICLLTVMNKLNNYYYLMGEIYTQTYKYQKEHIRMYTVTQNKDY